MLSTGVHYDKNAQQYQLANQTPITEAAAEQYFGHNETKPFYHIDFRHRRSMTFDDFFKEVDDLIILAQLGIAPTVYGYGINRDHSIHYGFIIMKKVDCSLKDIYLNRSLSPHENEIVTHLIDDLHNQYGMIHGDLKPSNIGVYLDSKGHIGGVCFFDCQKIKHIDDYQPHEFAKMADREMENFQKHMIKNLDSGVSRFKSK
jgi:serine/threonine-protein kinase RIO1